MKAYDFIKANIGQQVYLTNDRDLAIVGDLKPYIKYNHRQVLPLILNGLSKSGMARVSTLDGESSFNVRPTNVRLFSELIK